MTTGASPTWEQRWHPLREEWVILAAHRQHRPWIGATHAPAAKSLPRYVADCTFCPGNTRVSGATNPAYTATFVFDNDHPCVGERAAEPAPSRSPLHRATRAAGIARVLCFSPRHDLTLAEMDVDGITAVVRVWQEQMRELATHADIRHVLLFENKGELVGVSNPHPHGQLYATNFVWKTVEVELNAMRKHRAATGRGLLEDLIAAEREDGRRVLFEDEHAIAFVPYFARYAYEVYVAPKRRVPRVDGLTDAEATSLARALKDVTVRFDNLWSTSFPYVMPLHQAPLDGSGDADFHFFVGFLPPLRQPNLLKFLAGPEIGGGNFLSDTSPEDKAAELRAQSTTHWRAAAGAPGATGDAGRSA